METLKAILAFVFKVWLSLWAASLSVIGYYIYAAITLDTNIPYRGPSTGLGIGIIICPIVAFSFTFWALCRIQKKKRELEAKRIS